MHTVRPSRPSAPTPDASGKHRPRPRRGSRLACPCSTAGNGDTSRHRSARSESRSAWCAAYAPASSRSAIPRRMLRYPQGDQQLPVRPPSVTLPRYRVEARRVEPCFLTYLYALDSVAKDSNTILVLRKLNQFMCTQAERFVWRADRCARRARKRIVRSACTRIHC